MTSWTAQQMPDLQGRIALVTGANSGLGLATAQALAARHATVVLGCRDQDKAALARDRIRAAIPDARLELLALDLADLASVRKAAAEFAGRFGQLDLLINNAGVLGLPLMRTADGFEMLFGVNHLAHFALSALLLPSLRRAPAARIVSVSSLTHRGARLPLEDLNWQTRPYRKSAAYGQSKLANLLFMRELDRRLREHGLPILSIGAHPGVAATNIAANMAGMLPRPLQGLWDYAMALNNRFFAQPAELGALPSLYAATAPHLRGGEYFGPDGWFEIRGYPAPAQVSSRARDAELARALWTQSESLTGVSWDFTNAT